MKTAIQIAVVLLVFGHSPEIGASESPSSIQSSEDDDLSFAARSALVAGGFIAGTLAGIALAIPTFYLAQSLSPLIPFLPIALAIGEIGMLAATGAGISAVFVAKFPVPLIVASTALACTGVLSTGIAYFVPIAMAILEQYKVLNASDSLSQFSTIMIGSSTILLLAAITVGIEAGIGSIAFE